MQICYIVHHSVYGDMSIHRQKSNAQAKIRSLACYDGFACVKEILADYDTHHLNRLVRARKPRVKQVKKRRLSKRQERLAALEARCRAERFPRK